MEHKSWQPPRKNNRLKSDGCSYSGRTMVEMLGVLAIAGVLSVMVVYAFRVAMNRHYTDEILNEGNKRAIIVSNQITMNSLSPSLSEFKDNSFAGGTFDTNVVTDSTAAQFGLKVSDMPEKVCQNILSMISADTVLRRLAAEESIALPITSCAEPKGTYLMVYNDNLGTEDKLPPAKACRQNTDCNTTCATCQIADEQEEGICVGECDSECDPDGESPCGENECIICDAGSKTCKDGCIPLDYLESTGTQWIDTGMQLNSLTDSIYIKYMPLKDTTMGIAGTVSHGTMAFWNFYWCADIREPNGPYAPYRAFIITPKVNEISEGYISAQERWLKTGSTVWATNTTPFTSSFTTGNVTVFWVPGADSNQYKSTMKLYEFIIAGNQNMHLVPMHAPFHPKGQQNCMFDLVSKKLFCNQGGEEDFKIHGAYHPETDECQHDVDCFSEDDCAICDPDTHTCQFACTFIEYLQSTGAQYIDTRIPLYSDMKINLDYEIVEFVNNSSIMGANQGVNQNYYSLGMFTWSSSNLLTTNYNNHTAGIASSQALFTRQNIVKDANKTYLNGKLVKEHDAVPRFYAGGDLYLFWAGGLHGHVFENKSKLKVYSLKLFDDEGSLVHNFIPVLDPDNIPSIYDQVEKKLYYNQGSGQFITP